MLLETKISKDDGYQKQQGPLAPYTPSATSHASREIAECELTFPRREIETLIVWTEPNGTDMALSFQEAEGCAVIW